MTEKNPLSVNPEVHYQVAPEFLDLKIEPEDLPFLSIAEAFGDFNECAKRKGWWEDDNRPVSEVLLLMISELTEAFEEYRKGHANDEIYYKDGKPEGLPIEIADCIIRIGDFCIQRNIPILEALRIKHNFNLTRPYRHGGKKA